MGLISCRTSSELQYHVILARDLKLIDTHLADRFEYGLSEIRRMISSFMDRLRSG